jgi:hypothetical protein
MSFRLAPGAQRTATTCTGTIGGRPVRLVVRQAGGTVTCSGVPRSARGKLRIRMVVTFGDQTFTRTFERTIRA